MKLENLMKARFDIASNCDDFIIFFGPFFFPKKGNLRQKKSFIKITSCKMAKIHHQKTC
jgi:hypothetical protein